MARPTARAAALMPAIITSSSQKMTPLVRVVLLMRGAGLAGHLNNVFASGSVTVCHLRVGDRATRGALIGRLALARNNRNSCGDIKLIQTLSVDCAPSPPPLGSIRLPVSSV